MLASDSSPSAEVCFLSGGFEEETVDSASSMETETWERLLSPLSVPPLFDDLRSSSGSSLMVADTDLLEAGRGGAEEATSVSTFLWRLRKKLTGPKWAW